MHQEDQGRSNGWGLRLLVTGSILNAWFFTPYSVSRMDDLIIQHKRNWRKVRDVFGCAFFLGDFSHDLGSVCFP